MINEQDKKKFFRESVEKNAPSLPNSSAISRAPQDRNVRSANLFLTGTRAEALNQSGRRSIPTASTRSA